MTVPKASKSLIERIKSLNGEVERLFVDDIYVPAGRRALNADVVKSLAESMAEIGLMTPVTIRGDVENGNVAELVAGGHRLAAAKRLGWEKIACFVIYDRLDAEMWEISENLHRAELTALQKAEQVTRWISLWEKKVAQVAPPSLGRGKKGGNRETARQLRMDRREVERSAKIGKLSEQAKDAAVRAGLDDNQSALLKAASKVEPAEQVEAIETWGKKDGDPSGIWRSQLRELIGKIDAHLERAPSPTDRAYGLKRLDGKWQALPPHNADGEIIDEPEPALAPYKAEAGQEGGPEKVVLTASSVALPSEEERVVSSSQPILDPAPITPAEGAAAASACGEGTPAASSILSSDDWAASPEVQSFPDLLPFLDRKGRS